MPILATTTIFVESAKQNYSFFLQLTATFLGAFFAFLFFLIEEWLKRKGERLKEIRNEHAFVERYLMELDRTLKYDKGILKIIIEDYGKHSINLRSLTILPIRENISMKIKDIIFINKIEIYIANLKRLNLSLENIIKWKEKLDSDLGSLSVETKQRAEEFLKNFISEGNRFQKVFDFHLSEIEELLAENRVLLKKYKNWKFDKNKIEIEYNRRKLDVQSEIELMKNDKTETSMIYDYSEKLKKAGFDEDGSI